jgi:hypothetical protein
MQAKLKEIKAGLKARMHEPVKRQGLWLRQVVQGWFNHRAAPTSFRALCAFHHHVKDQWRRTLRRRGQKDDMTWTRIAALAAGMAAHAAHPPSLAFAALRRPTLAGLCSIRLGFGSIWISLGPPSPEKAHSSSPCARRQSRKSVRRAFGGRSSKTLTSVIRSSRKMAERVLRENQIVDLELPRSKRGGGATH